MNHPVPDLEIYNRLPAPLRDLARPAVLLSELTTLRIGGPAAIVCPIQNAEQALRFQAFCAESSVPATILGGGSNVLAGDDGFAGVVLHVSTHRFEVRGDALIVGAGLGFDDMIRRSLEQRLTGLEFASGIPGTVGGALVGNAGCYGHQIGDFLIEAKVLRADGRIETIGPGDFGFEYRRTRLQNGSDVVLEATLQLLRGDADLANQIRQEKIADRRQKHPVVEPCAGSWFKNLPPSAPGERRRAAGALLEQVGAKEMSVGGAGVFSKHANIIVNRGNASCADVLALETKMRNAVHERFGVWLEPEVRHLRNA